MLGGIHTSILTTVNVMLDLLSSPSELAYYSCLREEADGVFAKSEDWENQAYLGKLIHTDSAIRESLRRNPVIAKTGLREIIEKDGLNLPDGQKVPKGAWLAVPSLRVHYDERFYPRAELYEPFRFVPDSAKDRAEVEVATVTENSAERDSTLAKKRKYPSLSTASETYLAFGYGRHSWYVFSRKCAEAFPEADICKSWPLVRGPPTQVAPCVCRFSLRLRTTRASTTKPDFWRTHHSSSSDRKGTKTKGLLKEGRAT